MRQHQRNEEEEAEEDPSPVDMMSTDSSLSSLSSSPVSASFFTAGEITPEKGGDDTANTSPSQLGEEPCLKPAADGFHDDNLPGSTAEDNTGATTVKELPQYRKARELPHEIRELASIHLSSHTYQPAIDLLSSVLAAGGHGLGQKAASKAFVAPPGHLAYLASLATHPYYTNRSKTDDDKIIGTRAMAYLQSLLKTVGPVNARMSEAFEWMWRRRPAQNPGDYVDDDIGAVDDGFAETQLVFSRTENFWKLVGWAFNCSALHPERWKYWQIWLQFMVNVLTRDRFQRDREDVAAGDGAAGDEGQSGHRPRLHKSLLYQYVGVPTRTEHKAIVRALFADGSPSSLREFPELFKRETEERKKESGIGQKRKRDDDDFAMDESFFGLGDDEFDNYGDDDDVPSSSTDVHPAPVAPRRGRRRGEAPEPLRQSMEQQLMEPSEDYIESVGLRLQLFELVGQALEDFSWENWKPIDEGRSDSRHRQYSHAKLLNHYSEFCGTLRDISVPCFSHFVSLSSRALNFNAKVSLLIETISAMPPSAAPTCVQVDRTSSSDSIVTAEMLERCYLPYAHANNTFDGNAKFSLLIECLALILWERQQLFYSEALEEAFIRGSAARTEAAAGRKRRRGAQHQQTGRSRDGIDPEEKARDILHESEGRLKFLLKLLQDPPPAIGAGIEGNV